jgi:hypothetical protein
MKNEKRYLFLVYANNNVQIADVVTEINISFFHALSSLSSAIRTIEMERSKMLYFQAQSAGFKSPEPEKVGKTKNNSSLARRAWLGFFCTYHTREVQHGKEHTWYTRTISPPRTREIVAFFAVRVIRL